MSKEKMRTRLKTQEGQKIYSKRKTTVEPVFGIIKRVMGFGDNFIQCKPDVCTEKPFSCKNVEK